MIWRHIRTAWARLKAYMAEPATNDTVLAATVFMVLAVTLGALLLLGGPA